MLSIAPASISCRCFFSRMQDGNTPSQQGNAQYSNCWFSFSWFSLFIEQSTELKLLTECEDKLGDSKLPGYWYRKFSVVPHSHFSNSGKTFWINQETEKKHSRPKRQKLMLMFEELLFQLATSFVLFQN